MLFGAAKAIRGSSVVGRKEKEIFHNFGSIASVLFCYLEATVF